LDTDAFLTRFYGAAGIPVLLMHGGEIAGRYDRDSTFEGAALSVMSCALGAPHDLCYIMTDEQLMYGFARMSGGAYAVAGPAHTFTLDGRTSAKAARSLGVGSQTARFEWYVNAMPKYEPGRFAQALELLSLCLSGRAQTAVRIPFTPQAVRREDPSVLEIPFIEHLDESIDRELISYIEYGRYEEVERFFDRLGASAMGIPDVAPDVIRSIKNIYLYTLGVVSRTAAHGGLDYDTMTAMADSCLNAVELTDDVGVITNNIRRMFVSFARAVARVRRMEPAGGLAAKIYKVVRAGQYEKMTPTIIADRLQMNVNYLCTRFRKETGKTISQFVNEVKVEEAKRLLKNTSLTLSEIAARLDYSSQSYFQNVFKRVTGVTPGAFRG